MILEALAFPLRRDNAIFLAFGTGLCSVPPVIAYLLPALPYVGIIALIVEAVVLCYVLVYFQSVLETSMRGDAKLPMWPQDELQELLGKAFHVIVPLALSFMPLVAFVVWRVFTTGSWALEGGMLAAAVALFALGVLYLPVALLIFSFYGETAILNIVAAVRAIERIGVAYFGVVALVLVLFGAYTVVGAFMVRWPMVLAVPAGSCLFFYCMMVAMRAVGLLYVRHKERLGWEG